jgi:uncharacterized NAD(P)/FAD-binding protein YdhS
MPSSGPKFGIIGAGFSGSLLALHLLRRPPGNARVHLFEQRGEFGSGLAFSTPNASHLLNVRAERMSAFEADPEHFQRWLGDQPDVVRSRGSAYVPRGLYGRYVQNLLAEQLWGEGGNRNLFLFPDEVSDLELASDGVTVRTTGGRPVRVDVAVLAVGNFPPQLPPGAESLAGSPRYQADPWDFAATQAIDRDATVLVIGTGLTMVDFVLDLLDHGHRGAILALSRRGLLPRRHDASPPPVTWPAEPLRMPLSQRLHAVREAAKETPWRSVFDGLRPHTQSWWGALDDTERRRFLRHLRPWWDVHRHRMAPAVADRIEYAIQQGSLTLVAGRFAEIAENAGKISIGFRPRAGGAQHHLVVDHVVNCSGPGADYSRVTHPMMRNLLDRGMIAPDSLKLGLGIDDELRLLGADGKPQQRLYAIGPLTRGHFWECTAVPEIRRQAEELAARLMLLWA